MSLLKLNKDATLQRFESKSHHGYNLPGKSSVKFGKNSSFEFVSDAGKTYCIVQSVITKVMYIARKEDFNN